VRRGRDAAAVGRPERRTAAADRVVEQELELCDRHAGLERERRVRLSYLISPDTTGTPHNLPLPTRIGTVSGTNAKPERSLPSFSLFRLLQEIG
jgi:hypothetical protein